MPIQLDPGMVSAYQNAMRMKQGARDNTRALAIGAGQAVGNAIGGVSDHFEEKRKREAVRTWLTQNGGDPSLADADIQTMHEGIQALLQGQRDTAQHGLREQEAETDAMRRQAEQDRQNAQQIALHGMETPAQKWEREQAEKTQADTTEAFQPVTEPMPAKPMTVGGFQIGTQPQNLVEATQRDPTPEEIQMRLGRKGHIVDLDKLRPTTPKAPDPYGGRTREQYMRDKKEEAEATRAPATDKAPTGDDQAIPPDIAAAAEKKYGLGVGALAGKTYRDAKLVGGDPLIMTLNEIRADRERTAAAEHIPPSEQEVFLSSLSIEDRAQYDRLKKLAEPQTDDFGDLVAPPPEAVKAYNDFVRSKRGATRKTGAGAGAPPPTNAPPAAGDENLTPAQQKAKAAGYTRNADGTWSPPAK